MFERYEAGEQAILVHVDFTDEGAREDLAELKMLVSSAGANILSVMTCRRAVPNPSFLSERGKPMR